MPNRPRAATIATEKTSNLDKQNSTQLSGQKLSEKTEGVDSLVNKQSQSPKG